MISGSTGNRTFLLTPASKDYLWGGSRLNDDFNLNIDISSFAEAWVFSTHPDGTSFVPTLGALLDVMSKDHPEYLGTYARNVNNGELPILIKLIDAKKNLSVHVHENGSLGKTEMWYVLDTRRDSELVYSFNRNVDADQVRAAIEDGSITTLLNHVEVHKNDLFYIEVGTVHVIGAGCLISEIQESLNLTYRLYDYKCVDKNGKQRKLHIDCALDVMNKESSATPRQPMRVLKYNLGYASELLTHCKYFQVERLLLNTENRKVASFQTGSNLFHALLCVDGCGTMLGDDVDLSFFKGDCIFISADSIELKLHGQAQILNVSC